MDGWMDGLIKSQLIRFHRICTYPDDIEEATITLFQALATRGYSQRFLREIKAEVAKIFNNQSEYRREGQGSPLVPMVLTFSHHLYKLTSSMKNNFAQAQQECTPLRDFKKITAYRRNKNLKDTLVHTAFNPKRSISDPFWLSQVSFIFNKPSGRGLPVAQQITPQNKNVIYAIQCQHCEKLYVGETGRTLKMRMSEHLHHIRNSNSTTVLYRHFIMYGIHHLKYVALDSNSLWSKPQRKRMESIMINKLATIVPLGFNEKP